MSLLPLWGSVPAVLCPSCVLSQCLAHPQPTCCGFRVGKKRKSLDIVQALLIGSQNIAVLSTLIQSQSQNTVPYGLRWRKLAPSQPDPVHLLMRYRPDASIIVPYKQPAPSSMKSPVNERNVSKLCIHFYMDSDIADIVTAYPVSGLLKYQNLQNSSIVLLQNS